jgi:hypothetical protein
MIQIKIYQKKDDIKSDSIANAIIDGIVYDAVVDQL